MATISFQISPDLLNDNTLKNLPAALEAGAKVARDCIRAEAMARGVYDTGDVYRSVSLSSPKKSADGQTIYVTFKGIHQGNPRRNAEVAFVNEYGTRRQKARPFMREGVGNHVDEIVSAIENALIQGDE